MKAFQDDYPENLSHCYGCGAKNDQGHRIKTFWDGDETVTCFTPKACHSTGTAAAATYRNKGGPWARYQRFALENFGAAAP